MSDSAPERPAPAPPRAPASRTWKSAVVREVRRSRTGKLGLALVALFFLMAAFAPLLAPHDPYLVSLSGRRALPNREYPLGADELGRCILSRIIYGSRVALMVSFVSVLIATLVGVPIGVLAGYKGGKIDNSIVAVMDVLLSFPHILLAIAIVSALGLDLQNTAIAIGLWTMPTYVRLVRGSALSVKETYFVGAAMALGSGDLRIMALHVFPNCISPIIVHSTFNFARAILAEASLSFLGLGAQPPIPSWGSMTSAGRAFLQTQPHIATFPGLAIMLAVLGFNLLGDILRDALDPKSRRA